MNVNKIPHLISEQICNLSSEIGGDLCCINMNYNISAISSKSFLVVSQPMQASVIDLPYTWS